MSHDYFPTKEAALVDWVDNFTTVLSAHAAAWQVPAEEVTEVTTAATAFKPLHEQAAGPDSTPAIVERKNEAKEKLITLVRSMVNYRLANPAVVDNPSRLELGLKIRDHEPTPVEKPETAPELELKFPGIRRVDVEIRDEGKENRKRPKGVNGAVVYYTVGDKPATSLEELTHSTLCTRPPHRFEFTDAQRGKWLSVAARWQSSRGELGPASELVFAAIP